MDIFIRHCQIYFRSSITKYIKLYDSVLNKCINLAYGSRIRVSKAFKQLEAIWVSGVVVFISRLDHEIKQSVSVTA